MDVGAALSQGLGHAIVVVEAAEPAPAGRRRQAAVAWVQATRLGLSASVDQGGVQTWVTSLEDGRPLADVAVTLLPSGNAGRTDAQGLAELGVGVEDHTLVAERGADSAVLPGDVHWHGGSWRMPVQDELRWYLFTDRGLYQPGETARLKGWIRHVPAARSPQLALPTGVRSVGFTVRGPRGEDVGRGEAGVGGLGGFDFAMELPEALNLGYAHVELAARGTSAEPRSVSHPLQVQEFRRPEYEVAVQADPGPHVVGAAVDVTVRAAYFGGGGLRDAGVLWRVHSRPGFFTPPGWTGWHFGRPQWSVFAQPPTAGMKTFAAETDARGMHVLRIDLGAAEPPFTTVLDAAAQVQDLTRQVGSGSVDLLVHPAAVHVGVRVGRSWVRPGEPMGVGLIVVDHDGRIMAERPIEVTLQRVAWTFGRGMPREETLDVQPVCVLASAGEPVSCTATPDAPGMYRVRADVTDAAGRVSRTEQTLWVSGGVGMWRPDRPPGQVDLVPDRDEYQPGDTARVLVQPPFHPAEALLTLRQSGIIRTARFRIDAPTYELLVPIEETHVPGLNVHVALVEREDGTAGSSGEVRLAVPPHRRELDVRVAPRSTVLEPGAETTIDVHVVDAAGRAVAGADVALWLVDEAILGLGGYRVPDPLEAFYPVASPRVQDLAARDWVIRWPRSAGPGTLSGTLLDGSESGQPIPGAEVRVEGTDAAAVTTYDGAFTLRGLAPGDYVLRVLLPDGVSLRRAVSVPAEGTHLGALIVGAEGVLVGTRDAAARALAPREMEMQELSVAQAVAPPPAPPPPPGVAGAPAADGAVQVRTDFAPLALFEPSLRTGPDGRVQVRARMPGSLTRYRVMAVAVSGTDRFGRGEASITARRELMVRLSAPRFLNHGDRFDLPVLVQNGTDADIDVEVAVRAAGLHIHDDAGQRTRISAGSRAELRFEASAVHAGTVHIQAIAASGALSDATAVDLPVYTPATTEAFAVHGYLDTDAPLVLPLAAPRDVIPQFGGLDVSVTSTALHALSDAVLYLWATRYEGAEQIASRVLAVAALRDVLAAFAAQGLPEPDVVTASTQRDIAALVSLQTPDGGWGFWRRDERPHPYVSAHAAHALQRARDRGFDVSPAALQRAVEHLQRIDRHIQDWPQSPRRTMSAYALYVRHRLGDGSAVTQARQLAATRPDRVDGELTVEAMAWLLYVLADDPASRSEAAELLRRIANRVVETAGSATFAERYTDGEHLLLHSRRRTDAVALEALIAAQPDHDLIPRIAQSLLAHRVAGHWSGTQENSWVLLALDRYFRTYEAVTPDFRSDVWIGERYAAGHEFRGRSTERVHVPIPMAELADETEVVLSREGAGRMYYRAGLRYAPTDPRIEAEARGFTVSRRYEAVDDAADVQQQPDGSWHVRAGARVRVLVSLIAPSTRFHVALLDPLPAGFEPVNPELRGTGFGDESRVDAAPVRGPGLPRPWWFTHQNLRDDRAEVFATLLGAGSYEYSYLARATTPGTFVVPPARAEMMYEPETFGRGAGDRVVVTMPEPDRR